MGSLSHDGFSVKVRFAINGKSEKEVAKVIGDYQFKFKFPLELTNHGVYVVEVNTVNKSWGEASEPSTTAPIMNAYFHVNFTFNQDDEDAGSNGAETYERHRDAIQRVFADYLDCDKSAINATLISHTYETAEVRFVLTDVSERQVARKIDDDWHFLKLAWEFIKKSVPVISTTLPRHLGNVIVTHLALSSLLVSWLPFFFLALSFKRLQKASFKCGFLSLHSV